MKSNRTTPLEMGPDEFRQIGHKLVDSLAAFYGGIRERQVTPGESVSEIKRALGTASFPRQKGNADSIVSAANDLVQNHSLLNGHPNFMGYITSSPAPIGALADFLASAVNANVGAHILSPMATEIERQTVRWLGELIGVGPSYGGILVSGGNMANFTGFLAGRTAKSPANIRKHGLSGLDRRLVVYCAKSTHTWVEKAAVLFGLGSDAIRWIETDPENRMDCAALERAIRDDLAANNHPIMVIGTAGDVSTGAVDDLDSIAQIARNYDLWFHVDGAYGLPAAVVPELGVLFKGIAEADSIAIDPHKWLYSPLEAGCTLVKDPRYLLETFSSHPDYYKFDTEEDAINFYEFGLQNSRGFRALKVWMILQHAGREGFADMISEDIELAKYFFKLAEEHPELVAVTQRLSITTLRYVPADFNQDSEEDISYLDKLNEALLDRLQKKGEIFLSNAIVHNRFCLRGCIVNFRTSGGDIERIVSTIVREGSLLHAQMKPAGKDVQTT